MSIRRVTATAGAALVLAVAPAVAADLTPAPGVAIEDRCPSGRTGCVDRVVREMRTQLDPLLRSCHHDAVFALVYLRVTEEYRRTLAADPGVFADPAYVNREDAAFAGMYFDARDAYLAGRAAPPAWRVAFDASRTRSVTGAGSVLLAMNAHINRDLPFVLAGLGLRRPDGTSRKPDHDAVNAILHRAYGPALDEAAARLDPSIDDADLPTGIDDEVLFQFVVGWREAAWRNAQLLQAAPSGRARALVAASIESAAAATARTIRLSTSYLPPLTSPATRDAFCASAG